MRRLSPEERELWRQLRRSVRPLRPTPLHLGEEPSPEPPQLPKVPEVAPTPLARPKPVKPPQAPPLSPLGLRARRRLTRGMTSFDARIDLHGMDQQRAFEALIGFIRQCQREDARLALVITGKGRQSEEGAGVLRRMVPAWLARPEFRRLVLGFEEAHLRHGGGGALYVRIRRGRDAAQGR